MAWIAWLLEGLTLDSFALPTIWLVFGLLSQSAVVLDHAEERTGPGNPVSQEVS
jgi:hypothetical protein